MGEKTSMPIYVHNAYQNTPPIRLGDTQPTAMPLVFYEVPPVGASAADKGWSEDRAFGTHIGEAIAVATDWIKNR